MTSVQSPDPAAGWSDSSARAVLQLMVESVAEMIGFEVAVLSVVLEGELVTMAYTGPEEFREYLEQPDPISVLDPVLEHAETWGRFRFLAAEDYDGEYEGHWVHFGDHDVDAPDAWNSEDALLGLLTDDEDRIVGVLSVDRPVSGRRPDETQRRLLERYAAQRAAVFDLLPTCGAHLHHASQARRAFGSLLRGPLCPRCSRSRGSSPTTSACAARGRWPRSGAARPWRAAP